MSRAEKILQKYERFFLKLPKGWTDASFDKFVKTLTDKTKGDPEGLFRACMDKIRGVEGIDDPSAFCGAIKARFLGKGKFD